jgi:aminocarboxymuconate-semialdehyde decarboxylase
MPRMTDGKSVSRAAPAIDVHAHIVPPSVYRAVGQGSWHGIDVRRRDAGGLEIAGRTSTLPIPWPDEDVVERLASMDAGSVDVQVLSLLPSFWRYDLDALDAAHAVNDELAAIAEEHPRRFRVFAHLPMGQPDAAATELRRAMESPWVVGAAVSTNVNGANWDEPELFGVLEAAADVGAVVFFHPAHVRFTPHLGRYHLRNLIGNPTETTVAIASLVFGGVFERLPSLKAVFAHGGGYAAFAAGRFDHGHVVRKEAKVAISDPPSRYLPNLYVDAIVHRPSALRFLIDELGVNRIVLGSDYPADMGYEDPVGWIRGADGITTEERESILGWNALELLRIGPDEIATQGTGRDGGSPG